MQQTELIGVMISSEFEQALKNFVEKHETVWQRYDCKHSTVDILFTGDCLVVYHHVGTVFRVPDKQACRKITASIFSKNQKSLNELAESLISEFSLEKSKKGG